MSDLHRLTIRGKGTTGHGYEVLLDGQPVKATAISVLYRAEDVITADVRLLVGTLDLAAEFASEPLAEAIARNLKLPSTPEATP